MNKDEMRNLLTDVKRQILGDHATLREEMLDAVMAKMDKNGDGEVNKIEFKQGPLEQWVILNILFIFSGRKQPRHLSSLCLESLQDFGAKLHV